MLKENKSNKYGVIKIAEDVKGVIGFNYKNISKIIIKNKKRNKKKFF